MWWYHAYKIVSEKKMRNSAFCAVYTRFRSVLIVFGLMAVSTVHGETIRFPADGLRNMSHALTRAQSGDTVCIMRGRYAIEEELYVSDGVVFCADTLLGVELKGNGRGKLVLLSRNSTCSGFIIKEGAIGVVSRGKGNRIARCRITGNTQTGILCIGHLPEIMDNEIVFNGGSGIQGWSLRGTVYNTIRNNTVAYNQNSGIALDGAYNVSLRFNIIAQNQHYSIQMSHDTTNVEITENILYMNAKSMKRLPVGNFSCDPAFRAPRKLNFRIDLSQFCNEVLRSESAGARLHMYSK